MKILVGSKNPVKIESVKEAFELYYEKVQIISRDVDSGVKAQPVNVETYLGAENRALALKKINEDEKLNADFMIGVEGGIKETFGRWFAFGCMCLLDENGNKSFGTSAHFQLPGDVVKRLLKGEELGHVMDDIQNQKNTKQKLGAICYFTEGKMNRKELYIPGIISAIIPFLHAKDYFGVKR